MTVAFLDDVPGRPADHLPRVAVRNWVFVPPGPGDREASPEIGNALSCTRFRINGDADHSVLHILNVSFDGQGAERLIV